MVGPLAEAAARLGDGYPSDRYPDDITRHQRYLVRVLEPSPPAVTEDPYADDPPAVPAAEPDVLRVGPVEGPFDVTWHELALGDGRLAAWCADRWLGGWRALTPAPTALPDTREQLHALAEHVITPAREHAVNRISLRWTRGGFGTPYLPGDVQLRIRATDDGAAMVLADPDGEKVAPLTTLRAAAEFVGIPVGATGHHYKPLTAPDFDAPLTLHPDSVRLLADWFGFGTAVLEQLRYETAEHGAPGRVHLWPEHFDVAIEVGDEQAGARASVGASPGDAEHGEPYIYVAPWIRRHGGSWNDEAFGGASLSLSELVAAGSGPAQRELALDFFRMRVAELAGRERAD